MGNYIDIAYADVRIDYDPIVGAKWQGYTDAQKNNWIDYVEKEIDNIDWIGEKTSAIQAGEFPRGSLISNADDYDLYNTVDQSIIDKLTDNEDVIPTDLKLAVCETIIALIRTQKFQKLIDLQDVNTQSFNAGVSFTFREAKGSLPLPKKAWSLVYMYSRMWWLADIRWVSRI